MVRFRIGTVTATLIEEMVDKSFDFLKFFPLSSKEVLEENLHWMAPTHYDPSTGRLLLSMHSWLIDTGTQKILIDGCIGNGKTRPGRSDWNNLNTPFLERLANAGAQPGDIDFVLCTHLHADHIGWNTILVNGRWVPTFPNAKYVFSRKEKEYWDRKLAQDSSGPHVLAYQDSVLPIIAASQALVVDDYHEIADCLVLAPAPGHTPGHVAIWLKSGQQSGVFTGDIIHHPIQIKHPHWSCFGCQDQKQSALTRQQILEQCVENNALLLPAHFMPPHAGYIEQRSDGFALRYKTEEF